MNLRDRLTELLAPTVADLGLALWELEYLPRSNGALLRLYIDAPVGQPGGVTIDDCERVSHAVSAVLDAADPVPGHYTLEVSSPGLDRVLRSYEHFARYVGERVRVEMAAAQAGRKRFSGRLAAADREAITVDVDGQAVRLPLVGVHKARLDPEAA